MKRRIWVAIVNIFIMLSILTFVVIYSTITARNTTQTQIEHYEHTTVTMEHVTENYLEGEQRICDVWTHYINSENMTMEEAVSFIRISHVLPNASAHIVYIDTLTVLKHTQRTIKPEMSMLVEHISTQITMVNLMTLMFMAINSNSTY